MKHVGKFILRAAKENGMSLRALARESGVSNPYLSQLTRGLFTPAPEILIKLAPPLGVTPRKMFEEAGWLKPESTKSAKAKKK
jgi:transcriptional regulator with XRE-family HTH domain